MSTKEKEVNKDLETCTTGSCSDGSSKEQAQKLRRKR